MTERILIVHNAYQHRGGEDSVVEAEIALLRSHGNAVETYFRNNNDVAGMPHCRWHGKHCGQPARHVIWLN